MKASDLSLLLPAIVFVSCTHGREAWRNDLSIGMPGYDAIMEGTTIDGPVLRALQTAAADFFPATGGPRACTDTQEAHKFYAARRGPIIYVAIVQDPVYCGRTYRSLDSGARYAIGVDGRILRRLLDGEPALSAPKESDSDAGVLDGGAAAIDVTIPSDAQVNFPPPLDASRPIPDGGRPDSGGQDDAPTHRSGPAPRKR